MPLHPTRQRTVSWFYRVVPIRPELSMSAVTPITHGRALVTPVPALSRTTGDDVLVELRPGVTVDARLLVDFARRHGIRTRLTR